MDWAQILVIILAVFLAIFLLLAIVLLALLIRVTRQIKAAATMAQRTTEHIEHAVSGIVSITTPAVILKSIIKAMKRAKKD